MAAGLAGTIAGSVASGAAAGIAGKVLGGGSSFRTPSLRRDVVTPGGSIRVREGGTQATFGRSALMDSLLGEVRSAGEFGTARVDDLLGRVRPGFGELTDARVTAIDRARERTASDLRGALGRRRLLGSSFAADALTRADKEFAEQEQLARAQSFLEELDLTARLIDQRTNLATRAAAVEIDQANFETAAAANILSGVQSVATENARLLGEMAVLNSQGAGQFFGYNFNDTFNAINSSVSDWVSGMAADGGSV